MESFLRLASPRPELEWIQPPAGPDLPKENYENLRGLGNRALPNEVDDSGEEETLAQSTASMKP